MQIALSRVFPQTCAQKKAGLLPVRSCKTVRFNILKLLALLRARLKPARICTIKAGEMDPLEIDLPTLNMI